MRESYKETVMRDQSVREMPNSSSEADLRIPVGEEPIGLGKYLDKEIKRKENQTEELEKTNGLRTGVP